MLTAGRLVQDDKRRLALGRQGTLAVKSRTLAFGGTACSPGPDHQGPHGPQAMLMLAPLFPAASESLYPNFPAGSQPQASASAQPPVAQWVAPAKEESYFYLFLLNHELNLAANQVTMVICTGFTAVS